MSTGEQDYKVLKPPVKTCTSINPLLINSRQRENDILHEHTHSGHLTALVYSVHYTYLGEKSASRKSYYNTDKVCIEFGITHT